MPSPYNLFSIFIKVKNCECKVYVIIFARQIYQNKHNLMKLFKTSLAAVLLYSIIIAHSVGLSSCKKEIVNDTTFILKNDTTIVIKNDTTYVPDSVYNITDGLVAYYNFNGGNLNDSSGYGNNIVFNSSATPAVDRFGRANNAYSFDGASSYMTVNNASSLNPNNTITMMAIIKINGFYGGSCGLNQILGKGVDFNKGNYAMRFGDFITNSCSISPNANQETFNVGYASANLGALDSPFIKTGVWYNLIFTYDGFEAKCYLNGELKKTWTTFSDYQNNSNNLYIGAYEGLPSYPYYFNGVIDEIRIYNRDLPYGAIRELVQLQE